MAASLIPPTDTDVPDMRKIPDWLLNHPELRKRGIILYKPIQPARIFILSVSVKSLPARQSLCQFTVYQTQWVEEGPIYLVKALKIGRPEAEFYQLFEQYSDSPADHTVPHELIRCEHPLVVMPCLSRLCDLLTLKTSSIIAAFNQIMEVCEGEAYFCRARHLS